MNKRNFVKKILYWISISIRVLWEFNGEFKRYYIKGIQWELKDLENIFALIMLPPVVSHAEGYIMSLTLKRGG
ncbi:hypothetical protein E3E31_02285 [Thermococcus sp. M39]|uniref:hypothetical protein n=1 Tax=unclassified Thermococcus TaxID=2627626 RepID=UPI001438D02B|nr:MULTISPECIES: hypothetical protein [unclassified Thermococcus]NJE07373.1 hypothetical protein [Thermococcus sp. M39]NJE12496.1 hypothetical protein [Thermococcus sp. LS2]